ncbi:DUF1345 domain-containing protein [Paractinoplanes hotanensis]|uniref:DUF1345 domain-containing protein n=1 Tax=Paractinoplanes hotanensis TaxID=2906497 RepID=A0ABT0YBN2_9ACTN|nr:DUF1345 domain-containing protein [Actinoplanes hotanensis]MCM4083444.1 DUF1345 domain-containing protein [Actinoplanes hotanensis]
MTSLIISRFIEALLILIAFPILTADDAIPYILLWTLLAIVYVAIRVSRLRRSHKGRMEWLTRGLSGRLGLIFTIVTSFIGITAGLSITLAESDEDKFINAAIGIPAVLLAWAILHFGYAERYAATFYNAAERPLQFPNTDTPTFVEFAYFSFTLGTTFSVSDVETQTSAIRLQILSHSILSFIYNTATIGIAVSVITG